LVLITAMAENPASHKYDATKGITIRFVFSPTLGVRHTMKSKILSEFLNKPSFSGLITDSPLFLVQQRTMGSLG